MTPMPPDSEIAKLLAQSADRISVVVLLMIIVIGAVREWWVPGWVYRNAVKDRDEYKALLWQTLPMARQATQVATDVVNVLKSKDSGAT